MDAKQVAKHNSRESCWVIISNVVYDVTDFLDSHPGGSKIILKLAGQDATSEYDPIHPPGTLEENLKPSQILGPIDPSTLSSSPSTPKSTIPAPPIPPLEEQLNIDDFARTAEKVLAPKSWAYYSSASDDLITKYHNNTAYKQILLRPRIFRDVKDVDTTTKICGSPSSLPIFVSPAAMARLAHPTGEAGIAEACGAQGVIQCVSNNASLRPEQIVAARKSLSQPLWFQLYVQIERSKSEALLQRINTLGFTAIVLTLDAPTPGKREADERVKFGGETAVSGTSGEGGGSRSGTATAVKSEGLGRALFAGTSPSLTWEDLKWLRSQTHLPIILKGLQTHEDAAIAASRECRELGVTGIILSNHGGRGADTAPPPVYTLLEIRKHVPEVLRRLEVYVDGGIRRGTDVVKALCLGATAVGIGRPALFGLSGYGPEGVERVLTILREEVETAMRLLGVNKIEELGMQHINARALEGLIYMPEPDHGLVRAKL